MTSSESNASAAVADGLLRAALVIRVHDEPEPTPWLCGRCPYMNAGPICTKCGAPRHEARAELGSMAPRSVIDRWNEVDARAPLPSINDLAHRVGCAPPLSEPGDRFERGQVDIAMYWPCVLPTEHVAWENSPYGALEVGYDRA